MYGEDILLHTDGRSDHYWLCPGSCSQCRHLGVDPEDDDGFDKIRDRRLEAGLPPRPGYYDDWSFGR